MAGKGGWEPEKEELLSTVPRSLPAACFLTFSKITIFCFGKTFFFFFLS